MADTHGYSDVVFGLFALLGFRFKPGWPNCPTSGSGACRRMMTTVR